MSHPVHRPHHRAHGLPRVSRLSWLMGLYGENFDRVERLLDSRRLAPGSYRSVGHDQLPLDVDVLSVHAYMSELRLSYAIIDPVSGRPDPSVYVRIYRDARLAEATHCYVGRQWQDVLGMHPSPKVLFGHRLRMNSFLNKWLDYLDIQGHAPHSLLPRTVADTGNDTTA
jgi:uncharacterized protein YqiB (DUF1249 family)